MSEVTVWMIKAAFATALALGAIFEFGYQLGKYREYKSIMNRDIKRPEENPIVVSISGKSVIDAPLPILTPGDAFEVSYEDGGKLLIKALGNQQVILSTSAECYELCNNKIEELEAENASLKNALKKILAVAK